MAAGAGPCHPSHIMPQHAAAGPGSGTRFAYAWNDRGPARTNCGDSRCQVKRNRRAAEAAAPFERLRPAWGA